MDPELPPAVYPLGEVDQAVPGLPSSRLHVLVAQTSFGIASSLSLADDPYCTAGAQICDEYIAEVKLGVTSNSSACGLGSNGIDGYSDYTDIIFQVTATDSYKLTVTNGNPVATDSCRAWIDWNDDYVFAEDETYDLGTGVGPYSARITMPNALGPHRLRIRIDSESAADPCGLSMYGEVEDYLVNVNEKRKCGDVNCDDEVNTLDIEPFVQCLVLGTPTPPCDSCISADVNKDGVVNPFDIDLFVAYVISGG